MFYTIWVMQLVAHLSFLFFGIAYFTLGFIKKASPEIFSLGFVFFILFILQQRSKNNIKGLMRDRREFIDSQNFWVYGAYIEINERYSVKRKKKIPEKRIRKMKGGRYLGQAPIEPFRPPNEADREEIANLIIEVQNTLN